MQGLYLLAVGQTKAGLAVGTTTSAALLLLDIKRAYDVGDHAALLISAYHTPLSFRACADLCCVALKGQHVDCLKSMSSLCLVMILQWMKQAQCVREDAA